MSGRHSHHENIGKRVRKITLLRFSYTYICGSCRGTAVTIMEPGYVGVLPRGPFYGFSFILFAHVDGDWRHILGEITITLFKNFQSPKPMSILDKHTRKILFAKHY